EQYRRKVRFFAFEDNIEVVKSIVDGVWRYLSHRKLQRIPLHLFFQLPFAPEMITGAVQRNEPHCRQKKSNIELRHIQHKLVQAEWARLLIQVNPLAGKYHIA